MKMILFATFVFSTSIAMACDMKLAAVYAEEYLNNLAKRQGATSYVSGPTLYTNITSGGNSMAEYQYPFSIRLPDGRFDIGYVSLDGACEWISHSGGTASEKAVH